MKTEYTLEEIKKCIENYRPHIPQPQEEYQSASVLIPFYQDEEKGLSLIFMMRPDYPGRHGGQISFPGGKRDPEDKDELSAALRETEEEIGVDRRKIAVWGRLNTLKTYLWITPFVGQIPFPSDFNPDPTEVERLIIIPFSHILDSKNSKFGDFEWRGYEYPSHMFFYGDDVVWGLTARILKSFISLLRTGQEL